MTSCLMGIRRTFVKLFDILFLSLTIWIRYYTRLCTPAAITTGLGFTHMFVGKAVVEVLITYFTDSWKTKTLLKAVGIVNLLEGLSAVLVILMIYISEKHNCPLKVIIFSTAAYIIGMVMLCISAFRPIGDDETGKYFIPVVLLISVGKAGGLPILEKFLVNQFRAHEPSLDKVEGGIMARSDMWWITATSLSGFLTIMTLGNASWPAKFVSSTSIIGIGFLLFLCAIPLHLYHRSADEEATVSETTPLSPKGNENNGQVCSGSQAEEQRKPLLTMIPMWTAFLVFGLVLSAGNTFFTEQGNNMEHHVSIYTLLLVRRILRAIISSLFCVLLPKFIPKPLQKQGIIVIIWTGMVLSIFCSSVAWRVEVHRLEVINEKGLCGKPNEIIPMSIKWLLPQFCLLGLMEGLAVSGLDDFFDVQVSGSMENYGSALNEGVIGIGSFLNGLVVYLFQSWFSNTLNCSRLDKYYHMLTIVSFINLCYYWYVSTIYSNKKEEKDDVKLGTTREDAV